MSRRIRLKRTKNNATSLAVSLCVHVVALLCLFWTVMTSQGYQEILLTASSISSTDKVDEFSFTVFPELDVAPDESSDQLVEIDLLRTTESLDSLSSEALLEQLKPKTTNVEFFGSQAYGKRFVFILDISVSMSARREDRILRAKEELRRSISKLTPGQSYYILSFCWRTSKMYQFTDDRKRVKNGASDELEYVQATKENLDQLQNWLYKLRLGSGTDPRRALSLAHSLKPDAVFFLSDGDFNRSGDKTPNEGWLKEHNIPSNSSVLEGVKLALSDVPIHTIAYENPFTRTAMQQIADATGGTSRYVKTRSLQPLVDSTLINGLREVRSIRARFPADLERQHVTRLLFAKTLIEDGELAFAEYLVRPSRDHHFRSPVNRRRAKELFEVLEAELGDVRVEECPEISLNEIDRKSKQQKNFQRFPGYF